VLIGFSWAVVVALVVISAFHLGHREPWTFMVALIAVTPWIYMLAWATTSVGLCFHRRVLLVTSITLVALQLWWVIPDFDPISHLASAVAGEVHFSVFDANVSQSNRNLTEIASEIRRDKPQVVTMEELTPVSLRSLQFTHVMDHYRYHLIRATTGSDGMALWSVFPLADRTVWYANGHPELRTWLQLPNASRLRLDVLHTDAPYGADEPTLWASEIEAIRTELMREPRPLVAVGDLNATWYDWHFQALLALGLRDAAVVAGQGWRMTWPRDQQPVVPYLRIDHVLLSKRVALRSYSVVDGGTGSDHHPLLVTLGIQDSRDRE